MPFEIRLLPSAANQRDVPCAVITPPAPPRGVFYFFHGISRLPSTVETVAELYADRTELERLAAFHEWAIVAPFLGQTFGIDSEIDPGIRFATFLTGELPSAVEPGWGGPFPRTQRALTGFSMGGYAALNALCRAPEQFAVAAVRGSVTDLAHGIHDLHWDTAAIPEVAFGDYWENQRRYHVNSAFTLVNRIARRSDVAVGLEIGVEDFLLPTNRRFRQRLLDVGLRHAYAELPGGHTCDTRDLASLFLRAQALLATVAAPADDPS